MRNGFYIFDTHAHLGAGKHNGRTHTPDDLLRVMDSHGIDRALVFPFPLVHDYRADHDLIGEAIRSHPDRFSGAVCLNPLNGEQEFREEVLRCREKYGFCAIKLQPQYQPLNPVSASSDFFFETALQHGMPVIWHTGAGVPFALPSLLMAPARRFPDLTVIVAHSGGGLFVHEAIVAATFCPNIMLELSTLLPHQLVEVLARVPPDRLMIGTDLPENSELEIGKILAFCVPDDQKGLILSGTAIRVFQVE